jgi:hypothetical protein
VEAGLNFAMTSSIVTKATLSSDLEAAEARIAELEARLETAERAEVNTTVWVNDRVTSDLTRSGKLVLKFSGQKSAKLQDGSRVYGAYWNFVAYGELAERFQELNAASEKLLRITAFESPWTNGARKSDFVVTSLTPFERSEPASAGDAPATPFSGEPTDEEVPF